MLDNILLNVSVTGQQQHFRPFFDSRFTGHLLDFRLVIDTVLSILMSDVFLKTLCKRRKSDPFSTSVCSDGGGYLTSDHWGTQCSLWCKNLRQLTNFLYDLKYDCQKSYFWSTLGYNNYSYLGYNAAGVTGGYQVDWMKSSLHSYQQSQIQPGQKPQSSYLHHPW